MNNEAQTPESPGVSEPAEMNFVQRLSGVYFEPTKTFESINRKPTWLGIFLVVCVLSIAVTYVLTSRMDRETYMRKAIKANPITRIFTRNMTEEQLQAAASRPQSPVEKYATPVSIILGALVGYAILAGIFLLLFMMLGASIPFKKSLSTTVWAMGPPGIVVTVLSIIFMLVKDPQTLDINPAGNVVSNLGALASATEHPKLSSLLSSIDIFSFWTIFLLAVGFAACSERKLTPGKAATGIAVLWLLYVAGKVLLA
jgi:disulfide bond formation protein DsbB